MNLSQHKIWTFTDSIIILQHVLTSIVGTVGNTLVLIVYKNKLRDNETITFFIVHLAITDLACCILLLPINCYHELFNEYFEYDIICRMHSFLNIINITYSCLLMTLVAFERCFSIMYPFKKIVTKPRAKLILALLFLLCFSIGLIGALSVSIYHKSIRLPKYAANFTLLGANLTTLNMSVLDNAMSPYMADLFDGMSSNIKQYLMSNEHNNNHNEMILAKISSNTTIWETAKTRFCGPDNSLIPLSYLSNIRLFQNFIVVMCFTIIFILYALIFVLVSKRRQLKANRDNYYKELIQRSKQNTMATISIKLSEHSQHSRNNSFLNLKNSNQNVNKSATNNNNGSNDSTHLLNVDSGTDMANVSDDTAFTSEKTHLNNKATQTLTSSIAHIKSINNAGLGEPLRGGSFKYVRNQKSNCSPKAKFKRNVSMDEKKSNNNNNNNNNPDGSNGKFEFKTSIKLSDAQPFVEISSLHSAAEQHSGSVYNNVRYSKAILANLKTAFMLFVVTVIMAVVYTPSLLTSLLIIEYNPLHWNLIFINNAVNPLVYSFLNYNFRKSLRNSFKYCFNRVFWKNKTRPRLMVYHSTVER